jgi:hypothetical protein
MIYYLRLAPAHGMVMEFGVAGGNTLRQIAMSAQERTVYGFDWFKGLPEDWMSDNGDIHNPRGQFACDVPRDLPSNVELVVGLFQDTLPEFLARHRDPAAFVHIDCDLYSSTKFVLGALRERLQGTVIVFDEFYHMPVYEQHEGRAWREFIAETGYVVEELGQPHSKGAAFKIGG